MMVCVHISKDEVITDQYYDCGSDWKLSKQLSILR